MDANRSRLDDLNKRVKALVEDIAEQYISKTYPSLEVKADSLHCLSVINRRFPTKDRKIYQEYLWAAFYRKASGNKSSDFQLYITVHDSFFETGIFWGSRVKEPMKNQFREKAEREKSTFVEYAKALPLEFTFPITRNIPSHNVPPEKNRIVDEVSLSNWLQSDNMEIVRKYDLNDPMVTSPQLVNSIIEDFKKLEPIYNFIYSAFEEPSSKNEFIHGSYIVANLAWNDHRWMEPQIPPKSGYRYVAKGNMPHETLDFKFDKAVDTPEVVYGFFQCHGTPRAFAENKGQGKIIFFHSNGRIVGIYGNAQFLEKGVLDKNTAIGGNVYFNISGDRRVSFGFLPETYLDASEPHLNGQRVGQGGFNYLEPSNAKRILEDVIDRYEKIVKLNPPNNEAEEHLVKLRTLLKTLGTIAPVMKKAPQGFVELLSEKKQVILYGPPGTGKTFQAQKLAVEFLSDKDNR